MKPHHDFAHQLNLPQIPALLPGCRTGRSIGRKPAPFASHPRFRNGFTLIETLLSLLIVMILTSFSVSLPKSHSLPVFMETLQKTVHTEQAKSLASKQKHWFQIESRKIRTDSKNYTIPNGIACEPCSFSFNARGNINSAKTITCRNDRTSMKLVLQLATGSSHIEEVNE